jgi:hypothetical protein
VSDTVPRPPSRSSDRGACPRGGRDARPPSPRPPQAFILMRPSGGPVAPNFELGAKILVGRDAVRTGRGASRGARRRRAGVCFGGCVQQGRVHSGGRGVRARRMTTPQHSAHSQYTQRATVGFHKRIIIHHAGMRRAINRAAAAAIRLLSRRAADGSLIKRAGRESSADCSVIFIGGGASSAAAVDFHPASYLRMEADAESECGPAPCGRRLRVDWQSMILP